MDYIKEENFQLKINNWNINYEVQGKGNPVILLHGWLATLETMRPLANNLSQNFKVYLVDVVGFGKSDLPERPLKSDDFGKIIRMLTDDVDKYHAAINMANEMRVV